jgi:Sporulation protein YtfJ (Spore_YtfJ)
MRRRRGQATLVRELRIEGASPWPPRARPKPPPIQPPQRRTYDLHATLAERIGARFDAGAVFGAPVERDGVTVIPVAAIRFGIGGGGGSDPSKGQGGEGGGGGGSASAAGYIELKGGRSRFVPVVHPARMLALICCTVLAGLLILRPAADRERPSRLPWR